MTQLGHPAGPSDAELVSARAGSERAVETSAALFAGRYDVVRCLKDGSAVRTHLALDRRTGDRVVLKVIAVDSMDRATQTRFEHETAVLRRLGGAGASRLHDAGRTDEQLYLVQRFVPGRSLEQTLAAGPLSVFATLRVGIDVAGALDQAHAAHITHRDVKPANIIVDGQSAHHPDRATLVDFGFARSPQLDDEIRDQMVGTVRYLSPEAAGLLPTPPDHRSDLYSLGIVLFECLVGAAPFLGPTVGDLLRQHLSTTAPDLRTHADGVPRALASAVARLLRKDPGERYQSARALAYDLEQIREAIEGGDPDPAFVIGRLDRRRILADPVFVGRDAELASLGAVVQRLRGGQGALVLLEADSGGGKTRLLSEIREQSYAVGVTLLSGQGVAHAGQRPFTVLHGVADDLVDVLARDEQRRAVVAEELAPVAPTIVRALPALGAVLGDVTDRLSGPDEYGEARSLAGLRRLLTTVATAENPVLLILDDCQWADTLTVRLLGELFAGGHAPRNLAVIAAFRSEEVPAGHPLRALEGAQTFLLGGLPPRMVGMLAESMAGPLPPIALETVVRLADGNPFMAAAVLRGLVEAGALHPAPEGWAADAAKLTEAQAERRSAAFLVRRLELLSTESLRLLSIAAVIGKQFDLRLARSVADHDTCVQDVLDDARRRRLIWIDGDTGTFFHDKIRESLLDRLSPELRRELHGRAADAIIATLGDAPVGEHVFDLAYHLTVAERGDDALPYALAAARLARERYALDTAADHYRAAAQSLHPDDRTTRVEVAEGLADVLMLQGVYAEARELYETARGLVTDPLRAAEIDGKIGALAFKYGDIPTAKTRLEGALRSLGRRVPAPWMLLPLLVWELLVQAVHTLLPRMIGRRDPAGREADFLAMRIHSRMAYLSWFHSGKVTCAWHHLRELNLAERYPPSAELAQAWSEHAPVMTMIPWYRRGVHYAKESLRIRRDLGDVWGQGQSLNFTGVAYYAASKYDRARESCEEGLRLLRSTGDQWEINTAGWNVALCHLRQGDLVGALDKAREMHASGSAIGDETAAGVSLSVWARATHGRVPRELVEQQLRKGSADAQVTAELHLADALVHRADGALGGAADRVAQAIEVVHDAGLRQEYIAPIFAYQATILRELALSTPPLQPHLRRSRVRAAVRAARRARRWAWSYRNNVPHALREAALCGALRGRSRRAVRLLERSIAVAGDQGAAQEEALSRLALAEVMAARTGDDSGVVPARVAAAAFDPPEEEVDDHAHPATLSMFDRLSGLLEAGRAIAAATSRGALESLIRESTLQLMHAERCHITPITSLSSDRIATQSGEELDGISRTLLQRAVEEGRPVVSDTGRSREIDESLVLSGIRSALAAPIFVQGEVVSCLYVTHRQIGELFGEEEIQLAALIATLAGATYEHLAGSETRFRALVQSASDVITLVDPDGLVSYQSAAVTRVFGMQPSGLVGQPITAWVHRNDVDRFSATLATARFHDESRVECRFVDADGNYRYTENAITNLLDEPTVAALVINTRDVTDRKIAERQLREKNLELEKVSRAKDTFLASMSHELRTPLNAIIGFTGTLLMQLPGPLNADQERQLRTVERSGRHLLSIINDLLDMAKIESGQVRLTLEDVDCAEVVRSVAASLQPLADEKGLTLSMRVPETSVMARVDLRALEQIMINLVNNAVKFTTTGCVDVSLLPDVAHGAHRITVTDTGPGIADEDLTRIFDAFERGRESGPRTQEGTGLGLHISRKLAELIGARVSVSTQVGLGSTFTLDLGVARPDDGTA